MARYSASLEVVEKNPCMEIRLSPVESEKERRFIAGIRDISERRTLEQELQDTKLQDRAQTMVRELDGRILRWSTGMGRIYGYTREEAEGAVSHELLETEFPMLLSNIDPVLLRTCYWEGELVHRTKDGKQITVNSR